MKVVTSLEVLASLSGPTVTLNDKRIAGARHEGTHTLYSWVVNVEDLVAAIPGLTYTPPKETAE